MQMILGVMEGQIRGGYFPDCILDPSVVDPTVHVVAYNFLFFPVIVCVFADLRQKQIGFSLKKIHLSLQWAGGKNRD